MSETATHSLIWESDPDQWVSEEFDDTHLVYCRPSGETHFLNFLSFGVLRSLSVQSFSAHDLCVHLRASFALQAEELPQDLIDKAIAELDRAGLVTPRGTV